MNEQIKFRAWINIEEWKGYYYPNSNNEYVRFLIYQDGWGVVDCNDGWLKKEEFAVQRFTGLKDKNGKEIYEGDIVRDDENYQGAVKWDYDYAGWMFYDGSVEEYLDFQDLGNQHIQVIGNIYENPELLNT